MHLTRIHVDGVRNLEDVSLVPDRRLNVFVGPNGQGKTNLLEAIHLAAALRPLRPLERARDLVGFERERGLVRADFDLDGPLPIEVEVEHRGRKATLAGKAVRDVGEVASRIGVVAFLPEDAAVVRGGPEHRRRALDRFAYGLLPSFGAVARRYEAALERRNRVLRAPLVDDAVLASYTAPLVEAGAELVRQRALAAARWSPAFAAAAASIGGDSLGAGLRYRSSLLEEDEAPEAPRVAARFAEALEDARDRERQRGATLVGPHLDDLVITKGERRARHLASQGEARAIVLAMKLASVRVYKEARGTGPLLLLDDVAGELDPARARKLFAVVDEVGAQAFVTTTHLDALPPVGDGLVASVSSGRIVEVGRVAP